MTTFHPILFFAIILTFLFNAQHGSANFIQAENWPEASLNDENVYGSSVSIHPTSGEVLLLHRGEPRPFGEIITEDVLLVLSQTNGSLLRSWGGEMFKHPHGLEVTPSGDIFITDQSNVHLVTKYQTNASTNLWDVQPVLELGIRGVPGNDTNHFNSPADVAFNTLSQEFFIADGYGNRRVVHFTPDGNYSSEFESGTPDKPFNIVHGLIIAHDYKEEDEPILFVADRDNYRIHAFNLQGQFLYEINQTHLQGSDEVGMMFNVAYASVNPASFYGNETGDSHGLLYAVTGVLTTEQPKLFHFAVGMNGFKLLGSYPVSDAPGDAPHDLAVSSDGETVYVVVAGRPLVVRKFEWKGDEGTTTTTTTTDSTSPTTTAGTNAPIGIGLSQLISFSLMGLLVIRV